MAAVTRLRNGFPSFFKALLLSFCVASVSLPSAADAVQSDNLSPSVLIDELRKGGLVLYVRHAATDHDQSDKDLSDFSRCDLQRNLSEQGKNESGVMGETLKHFGIDIGEVFTSPYCRCVDTAKIAFGRYKIVANMRATFFTNEQESKELADFLRAQLSKIPVSGTNTILIGHTANLRDVTEVWPKPEGVAHVFRPLGQNGFRHLGRIVPTDWPHLRMSH